MLPQNRRSDHVPRDYKGLSELPKAVQDGLHAYGDLIREWAPRTDLVAPGELDRFDRRHLEDSLKALPLIDALPVGPAVDVGSGAGLPGLPLAIAGRRRRAWLLLEPRHKRAAFLDEAVRSLGLDHVEVRRASAEAVARTDERYVLATARALAPPVQAFGLLTPLLRPEGVAVVWVGRSAELPPEAGLWAPGLATMPTMAHDREKLD